MKDEGRAPGAGSGRLTSAAPPPSTVAALLDELGALLGAAGVPLARDEARDILAALLDVPRFWPTLHRDALLDASVAEDARRAARRRGHGAPFAYAVGRAAFRHLTLDVDERVLIPRQETELLVDFVLDALAAAGAVHGGVAIDVGTGSGAIALALATEGRFDRVIATDVSHDALAVAEQNARLLGSALLAPVDFVPGSFLAPVGQVSARLVVSNPPYIAYSEMDELPPSVRDWEPPVALYSADTGLAATRTLVREAALVLEPDGLLALEADSRRAALVAEMIASDRRYADVAVRLDLTGRERFVLARRARRVGGGAMNSADD